MDMLFIVFRHVEPEVIRIDFRHTPRQRYMSYLVLSLIEIGTFRMYSLFYPSYLSVLYCLF